MTEQSIIRSAMEIRGFNQTMLAKSAGLKRQSNVSELLRGRSLRVDNFVKLLDAMGFDVVVRDRNSSNKTNTWTVTCEQATHEEDE